MSHLLKDIVLFATLIVIALYAVKGAFFTGAPECAAVTTQDKVVLCVSTTGNVTAIATTKE